MARGLRVNDSCWDSHVVDFYDTAFALAVDALVSLYGTYDKDDILTISNENVDKLLADLPPYHYTYRNIVAPMLFYRPTTESPALLGLQALLRARPSLATLAHLVFDLEKMIDEVRSLETLRYSRNPYDKTVCLATSAAEVGTPLFIEFDKLALALEDQVRIDQIVVIISNAEYTNRVIAFLTSPDTDFSRTDVICIVRRYADTPMALTLFAAVSEHVASFVVQHPRGHRIAFDDPSSAPPVMKFCKCTDTDACQRQVE